MKFWKFFLSGFAGYFALEAAKGFFSVPIELKDDLPPKGIEDPLEIEISEDTEKKSSDPYPIGWGASQIEIDSLVRLLLDHYLRRLGQDFEQFKDKGEPGPELAKVYQLSVDNKRIGPLFDLFVEREKIITPELFDQMAWAAIQFQVDDNGILTIDLSEFDSKVKIGKKTIERTDEEFEAFLTWIFEEALAGLQNHIKIILFSRDTIKSDDFESVLGTIKDLLNENQFKYSENIEHLNE